MAHTVKDFREFVSYATRQDITKAVVKKNANGETKFKLHGPHKVYTLTEADEARAQKIIQTLPPDLEVTTISSKSARA